METSEVNGMPQAQEKPSAVSDKEPNFQQSPQLQLNSEPKREEGVSLDTKTRETLDKEALRLQKEAQMALEQTLMAAREQMELLSAQNIFLRSANASMSQKFHPSNAPPVHVEGSDIDKASTKPHPASPLRFGHKEVSIDTPATERESYLRLTGSPGRNSGGKFKASYMALEKSQALAPAAANNVLPLGSTNMMASAIALDKYDISRSLNAIEADFVGLKRQVETYQAAHGTFVGFGHITCIEAIVRNVQHLVKFVDLENVDKGSLHLAHLETSELSRLYSSYKNMIQDCFNLFEYGETMNKERANEKKKIEKMTVKMKEKIAKHDKVYKEEIKSLKSALSKLDEEMKTKSLRRSERQVQKDQQQQEAFFKEQQEQLKQQIQEKYLTLIDELKTKTTSATQENSQLKTYCKDLETSIDKWHTENQKLRDLIQQLKEETKIHKVAQEQSKFSASEQVAQTEKILQEQNAKLLEQIQSESKNVDVLRREKEEQTKAMNELKEEIKSLHSQQQMQLQSIQAQHQQHILELREEQRKQDSKTQENNALLQKMMTEALASPKKAETEKTGASAEEKRLQELVQSIKNEKESHVSELKAVVQDHKSTINKLTSENESLKHSINQLKHDYKTKQEQLSHELSRIQHAFHESQQDYAEMEAHLMDYERQHCDIIVMMDTLKEVGVMGVVHEAIGERAKEAQYHPFPFSGYVNQLQGLYVRLKQEKEATSSKIEVINTQDSQVKQQNEALALQLKHKNEMMEELKHTNVRLLQQTEQLDKQHAKALEDKQKLREKLTRVVQGCKNIFGSQISQALEFGSSVCNPTRASASSYRKSALVQRKPVVMMKQKTKARHVSSSENSSTSSDESFSFTEGVSKDTWDRLEGNASILG